jgi:PilZ domain
MQMRLSNLQIVADRRNSARISTYYAACRVKVIYPTISESLPAHIVNMSKDGLGLLASVLLEPGWIVEVFFDRFVVIGEVRYCIVDRNKFRAGIHIDDVFAKQTLTAARLILAAP